MPDPYDTANPPQSNPAPSPTTEGSTAEPNPFAGMDRPTSQPASDTNYYSARGGATAFNESQYDVGNLSYPADLFNNNREYGGNYVVFYINTLEDSKLTAGDRDIQGNPVQFVEGDIPPRDRGDLVALNLTATEMNTTIAAQSAIAAGAASGVSLSSLRGAATAAAINAGGAVATSTMAANTTRATKRLRTAIALHNPNQMQIRYAMQWQDESTAGFAVTQGLGGAIMNAISSGGDMSQLGEAAQGAAANLFLSKSPSGGVVSAATGLAANPKKEQLFKGVDYRTFTMEYQFFPRNQKEAENVMGIIKQFKYHMHPEFKDNRNFVYLYPSEFDIYYYKDGRENLNLHRHTSCVLTDMNINYTPNGVYSTFPNGMSTQINVAMNFKELALLTKDKIMDGM